MTLQQQEESHFTKSSKINEHNVILQGNLTKWAWLVQPLQWLLQDFILQANIMPSTVFTQRQDDPACKTLTFTIFSFQENNYMEYVSVCEQF